MAKEVISATINSDTVKSIKKIAEKEKRSFSQMVDLLLQKALSVMK